MTPLFAPRSLHPYERHGEEEGIELDELAPLTGDRNSSDLESRDSGQSEGLRRRSEHRAEVMV